MKDLSNFLEIGINGSIFFHSQFELIYFPHVWINAKEQYRWFQVDYRIGVFIARSSVNLFKIKQIWVMALLQGINVSLFLTEAIFYYVPSIWLILLLVFWEGLLGGSAYVNTLYRITEEVSSSRKLYALTGTLISDATGIALAGKNIHFFLHQEFFQVSFIFFFYFIH